MKFISYYRGEWRPIPLNEQDPRLAPSIFRERENVATFHAAVDDCDLRSLVGIVGRINADIYAGALPAHLILAGLDKHPSPPSTELQHWIITVRFTERDRPWSPLKFVDGKTFEVIGVTDVYAAVPFGEFLPSVPESCGV